MPASHPWARVSRGGWIFDSRISTGAIEARERRAIAAIFKQAGEPYFRGLERAELSMLVPDRHLVVATGGGTFVDPENRAVMLADGAVAWLDLPFSDVLARLPTDGRRPLAADRASWNSSISCERARIARPTSGLIPVVRSTKWSKAC